MKKLLNILLPVLLAIPFSLFVACDSGGGGGEEEPKIPVPTDLKVTNVNDGVTLSWSCGTADKYEVVVTDVNSYESTGTSYKVTYGDIDYEKDYNWQVRAVVGDEKGAWASSSFRTANVPAMFAYVGDWKKDPDGDLGLSVTVGDDSYPLGDMINGFIPDIPYAVTIARKEGSNSQVYLDMGSLTELIGLQDDIFTMSCDATGKLFMTKSYASGEAGFSYSPETPLPLSQIPGLGDILGGLGVSIGNASLVSVSAEIRSINLRGEVTNAAKTAALFSGDCTVKFSMTTDDPGLNIALGIGLALVQPLLNVSIPVIKVAE